MLILILASVATFVLMIGIVYALKLQENNNKEKSNSSQSSSENLEIAPISEDYVNVLICGIDRTDILTDVLLLGRFDIKNKKIEVLQIPRDTYIGTAYKTGKINAVYGHPKNHKQGIDELIQVIEDQFVLDIDYYATISLDGLVNMVDAMGGIEIDLPIRIEYAPGKVMEKGLQTINGEQAEWLVRFRSGYKTGDIGRMNAQELFLKSAIKAVKEKGRMKSMKILMDNFSNIKTDMPIDKAISLANEAFYINDEDINMTIVPGNGKMNRSYAVYEVDKVKLAEILNEKFRIAGEEVSAEELNIPLVPYTPPPPPVIEELPTESSGSPENSEPLVNNESSSEESTEENTQENDLQENSAN